MSNILRRCGEALYGPHWQAKLAIDLNVSDRTLRRWIAGTTDIPAGIFVELREKCKERVAELNELIINDFPGEG